MKIAIVKLSALGDIIHAMVALQFIKADYPAAQIDWLVEQNFSDILADNPDINRILPVNLKSLKTHKSGLLKEIATIKAYAKQQYDLVIDAQGLIKSALAARLLSSSCIGFDKNSIREKPAAWLYGQTVACPYDANSIDRNVGILTRPLGIQVSSQQILGKQPFLFHHSPEQPVDNFLQAGVANVLLVIGSTWPSRNYPREKFLQIVRGLAANCLICWGNAQERQAAEWIALRSEARVLPRLSLNDLKYLISRTDLLIGNDTGPTHMAWGLNRPSITLFGPTPISRVYLTDINKVLKSPSAVNPFKLNKNDFSIAEIPETEVIALAKSLLYIDSAIKS
ncbi:MAG: lipopolysaccharide heptosyltransferase I [Methylococcales bacterium]|nr:lipopolysaccharide heptosyltransferase I [Methylococcales bacterium]